MPEKTYKDKRPATCRTFIHAQLGVSQPGDPDELEAERVSKIISEGGKIHRSISHNGSGTGINVSCGFGQSLFSQIGGGSRMPEGLRSRMEESFGQDFSGVRIHNDSTAASMSRSIDAKAFTYGNDIYFNDGQYDPQSREGQSLIAHELTHVVQGGGHIARKEDDGKNQCPVSDTNDYFVAESRTEFLGYINQLNMTISHMDNGNGMEEQDYKTELANIGGRGGIIGPRSEIESWQKQHKREIVLGTLDNIRGGLGGSFSYGVALVKGIDDLEMIYNMTSIGAGLDAMAGAFYNNGSDSIYVGRPQSSLGITTQRTNVPQARRPEGLIKSELKSTLDPVNKFMEQNKMRKQLISNMYRSSSIRDKIATLKGAYDILEAKYKATGKIGGFSKHESIEYLDGLKNTYQHTLDTIVKSGAVEALDLIDTVTKNISLIDARIEILKLQNEAAAIENAPFSSM